MQENVLTYRQFIPVQDDAVNCRRRVTISVELGVDVIVVKNVVLVVEKGTRADNVDGRKYKLAKIAGITNFIYKRFVRHTQQQSSREREREREREQQDMMGYTQQSSTHTL